MNYKQYNKSQSNIKPILISLITCILFITITLNLKIFEKDVQLFGKHHYSIIKLSLSVTISSFLYYISDIYNISPIRFIKKTKITYLPVSEIIALPGFNAKHFLENSYTKSLILENNNFEGTPLLEKVNIKNKPYIVFTEKTKLNDNSKRSYNYLLVDKNENYITEIPREFKYTRPKAEIFKYYTKYSKKGILPIITNIKNK